jgi:glycosyltransferase involved in cell wall biosynthesis
MRIVMLAQFYPPIIGGEERHVANLSKHLAERGHEVAVVTLWHEGMPEFEVMHGVRIYRIRGTMQRISILFSERRRQYAPPFPDPELLLAIRRIIVREQPDIIHAHNWLVHSFTPLKGWSKAKLVMSLHDCSLACVQKRFMRHDVLCTGPNFVKCVECATHFYGFAKGPVSALANFFWAERERQAVDMFLPVSQAVVESNQLKSSKVPYRIIPNFIPDHLDTTSDDSHSLLAKLPAGEFLLFVGDITLDKGAKVLLQAYEQLETELPLVFIGRSFIPGLADNLPPHVFLLGPCPHEVVMAAWRRCAIALMPSLCPDASPTVAMEAMAMGCPIISSRIGGLVDIVADGETGFLVSPGDIEALRKAIESLLDNPMLREQMGAKARERVVLFQAKSVVTRIEEIYQELLKPKEINSPVLV